MSRSPSPVPPPRKAPVKIIRPPKEPVASSSKLKQPAAKATTQKSSQPKTKAQKSAPQKSTLPKQLAPIQLLPPPPMAAPPSPPSPFFPSDLYISMMSGLAMANMPQTMQAAANTDPMAAFQFAQMCFAPPPAFPLPPVPFAPPRPDPVTIQPRLHAPSLPPKPVSDLTPKPNPKLTPASPSAPSPVLQEGNPRPTRTSSSILDPFSVTMEMDPEALKLKQFARRSSIGWIPVPGFPDRGRFDFPTSGYRHWSCSGEVTEPNPRRSLVMEDLPLDSRTTEFVRSWSDRFLAVAVHVNGGGKALIEFPSREVAERAYNSPRLRDGPYKRAGHVRVFWYRPPAEDVASTSTTNGNTDATGKAKGVPTAMTTSTAPEEPTPTKIENSTSLVETSQLKARSKGKGRGASLPLPECDAADLDLPARSSTAPTSTLRPESPFVTIRPPMADREQRQRLDPTDRGTNWSVEGSERTPSRPPASPSPSVSSSSHTKVPSPHLHSPSPEIIQQERTPNRSPPSLRYPSSTPEMTNNDGSAPSTSDGASTHGNPSPTSASGPSVIGGASLEQQLRMRLLAMKQSRIANKSSEQSSPASTPSAVVDPEPETLFKVASPPPVSQTTNAIVVTEGLELLATSFITDTLNTAQGLPSQPDVFDTAMSARLSKKRGSSDAFGSSADIAFKRQRLAQQIQESKRIMEQWRAAKTKEERNRIFVLWEESNRFVSLTYVDCALVLPHDLFSPLFLGPWSCFQSPQLRPFSGHVMRRSASSSIATMRTSRWTCLDRQPQCSTLSPFVEFVSVASFGYVMSARPLLSHCIFRCLWLSYIHLLFFRIIIPHHNLLFFPVLSCLDHCFVEIGFSSHRPMVHPCPGAYIYVAVTRVCGIFISTHSLGRVVVHRRCVPGTYLLFAPAYIHLVDQMVALSIEIGIEWLIII